MRVDERRAEVFLLYSTGWSQARLARRFGVAQSTISKDIGIEMRARRSRAENVEEEIERIAGVVEGVMVRAWERHNEAADNNISSVAGANYLKIVLDAAERYAALRGFDSLHETKAKNSQTRVIVQIGGTNSTPPIAVGVES